jgi:hypothetical protein
MALINLGDGNYSQPDYVTNGGQGITDPTVKSPTQPSYGTNIPSGSYNRVATAPDGVPVFQNGNAYFTHNADNSFTQQFQGGLPDWLTQASTTQSQVDPLRAQIAQWASMPGADPSLKNDPEYWVNAINSRGGLNAGNTQYWQDASVGPNAFYMNPGREGGATTTGGYGASGGGAYSSTNPFSDPATKNYVDLLNSRMQSLLTPQANPQMDSLLQYMNQYFQQLQQPTYTDAQRGVIATQQLDPMERQRQAELKNVANVMASRGITPGSGPYLQAERDINQKYDTLRAQTQGQIANNEITLGRQNQAQAVDVGSAAASLVNGMNSLQDQRANQAVSYGRQIPDLAQQRLQQAITLLNGNNVNPAQLLPSLSQFQQQGITQNTQDSQFYQQLFAALAKQFGL